MYINIFDWSWNVVKGNDKCSYRVYMWCLEEGGWGIWGGLERGVVVVCVEVGGRVEGFIIFFKLRFVMLFWVIRFLIIVLVLNIV